MISCPPSHGWTSPITYISSPIGRPSLPGDDDSPPPPLRSLSTVAATAVLPSSALGVRLRRLTRKDIRKEQPSAKPQEIWLEDDEPDWGFTRKHGGMAAGMIRASSPTTLTTSYNSLHTTPPSPPSWSLPYSIIPLSPKSLARSPREYHYKRKHSSDSIASSSSSSLMELKNSAPIKAGPPTRPPRPPSLSLSSEATNKVDSPSSHLMPRRTSSPRLEMIPRSRPVSPRTIRRITSSDVRLSVIKRRNSELFSDPYKSSTSPIQTSTNRPISQISSVDSIRSISGRKSKSQRGKNRTYGINYEEADSSTGSNNPSTDTTPLTTPQLSSPPVIRRDNRPISGVSFINPLSPPTPPPTQPMPTPPVMPSSLKGRRKSSQVGMDTTRSRRRSVEKEGEASYRGLSLKSKVTESSSSMKEDGNATSVEDIGRLLKGSSARDLLLDFPLPPARDTPAAAPALPSVVSTPAIEKSIDFPSSSRLSDAGSLRTDNCPILEKEAEEVDDIPQSPEFIALSSLNVNIEEEVSLSDETMMELGESSEVDEMIRIERPASPSLRDIVSVTPRPRRSMGAGRRLVYDDRGLDSSESDIDLDLPLSVLALRERVVTTRSSIIHNLGRKSSSSSIAHNPSRRISTLHLQDGRALTRGRGWSDSEDEDETHYLPRKISFAKWSPPNRRRPTLVINPALSDSENQITSYPFGTERYSMVSSSSSTTASSTIFLTPSSSRNPSRTSPGLEIMSESGWAMDGLSEDQPWVMKKPSELLFLPAVRSSSISVFRPPAQAEIQHWGDPEITIENTSPKTEPVKPSLRCNESTPKPVSPLPTRMDIIPKNSSRSPTSNLPSSTFRPVSPVLPATLQDVSSAIHNPPSAPVTLGPSKLPVAAPIQKMTADFSGQILQYKVSSSTTDPVLLGSAVLRSPFAAAWGARRTLNTTASL